MDGTSIAAIVVGLAAAIGGYLQARKTTRPAEISAESAHASALLASYDAFAERLQTEADRVRADCERRVAALEEDHAKASAQWRQEKAELEARIDALVTQVNGMLSRSPASRERRTDKQ